MNIQNLCYRLRTLSCLITRSGKTAMYSRQAPIRFFHATTPHLASATPSTSTPSSTTSPSPSTTTTSTTTSTDLFRQALQDAQDKAPAPKKDTKVILNNNNKMEFVDNDMIN